jgi:hypothetical protein
MQTTGLKDLTGTDGKFFRPDWRASRKFDGGHHW